MKTLRMGESITKEELSRMAGKMFGGLVKAVIDIDREILVVDAELHADQEKVLLEDGSRQEYLWGINIYPEEVGEDFIEFDSMINVRPGQGNRSRGVEDVKTQKKIQELVEKFIV